MVRRYKVTAWHGEAETLWHVVDTHAPEGEQPAVVWTFHSPMLAHCEADLLNDGRIDDASRRVGA